MDVVTITFLGTGTSIGIPVIGCDCAVCQSDNPKNKRTRASVYVETPDQRFLIDAGPDLREQCLREGIKEVDSVIFTHEHSDHIMGFDDLRRFSIGADQTLPIYATPSCLQRLTDAFRFAFDKSNWYPGYLKPLAHTVEGPFKLAGSKLTPLEVKHGKVPTIGYLLERDDHKYFAYLSDCKTISEPALDRMEGVDTLIIDCLKETEHPTHMSFSEAMQVRDRVKPKRTLLTHISDAIEHDSFEAKLPDDVRIAYDGLKLSLG